MLCLTYVLLQLVQKMISPEYGESLRAKIFDNTTFNSSHYGGDFAEDRGTSHISILGEDGSAVSATSTINTRLELI